MASWHADHGVGGGVALERRTGLLGAVDEARTQGLDLVVAKRDRLARDVIIAAMVERLVESGGGRVVSADGSSDGDGPEGALMRRIVDAFAEYERALIRARTRSAMAVKTAAGESTGCPPMGKRAVTSPDTGRHLRLEPDPRELAVLGRVEELLASGYSLRRTASILELEGHRSRSGRPYGLTQVARMSARVRRSTERAHSAVHDVAAHSEAAE